MGEFVDDVLKNADDRNADTLRIKLEALMDPPLPIVTDDPMPLVKVPVTIKFPFTIIFSPRLLKFPLMVRSALIVSVNVDPKSK